MNINLELNDDTSVTNKPRTAEQRAQQKNNSEFSEIHVCPELRISVCVGARCCPDCCDEAAEATDFR